MISRRKFIAITGSTAVIMAAGKAAIGLDKMSARAIAAWSPADSAKPDSRKPF